MNMRGKRKIGRKILAFVLSVCMLFTVQPNLWDGIMVQAAEKVENDTESGIMTADDSGQHTNHTGWIALKTDNENATQLSSGNYYLEKSVNMGTITIAENANVTLCLNGKTLKHIGESGSVIVVGENAKFTLCDCQDHWDYISSFDESSKTYSCRVTGQGGCIIGGNGNDFQGGGVYVSSDATFNMNSGRITECDVGRGDKHYGGGVYIKSGTFNMSGGVIDNNSANAGGGVYLEKNCTFEMGQEAVIMCNTAYGTSGGVACSGEFNMRGGKVLGNRADEVGGVTIGGSAFIENGVIEGNISEANISEDSVFAAGLQIQIRGNVKISGGTIRYNIGNSTSDMGCAGVKPGFPMSKLQMSGHVEIYDNYNNGTENNLFLINNKTFSIIGDLSGTIGITSATKPATGSPVIVANGDGHDIQPEDWYCITSDEEYKVTYKDTGENSGNQILLEKLGDCDLSGLILTAEGAKLEPNFQADITTYEATVGNDVEKVGITATLASSTEERTVKIKNGTVLSETEMTSGEKKDVPLAVGSNKIEITVTSGSGSDTKTKTYTLNITRKASDVPAEYKVTLNGNDGTGTDLKSYTYGIGAKLPADWTKTGYDFAGWYEDESCEGTAVTEISATTTGDKEYWAKWTAKTYTVAYSSNGGTIADENNFKEYTYGMGLTLPTPAKTGYTFDGWYEQSDFSGSKVTSISTTDTGAKTYYAKWTLSSYTISYNLDGGTAAGNPTTYTVESSTITLNNPTKEGYTFTGWSGTGLTGEQNTTVTISKGSTGHRTYTAHWKLADYTVTLHPNGGTGGTDLTAYTYGSVTTLPTNWTKKGYVFDGWYVNENFTGTAVTNISGTDTGNKEYWAKWTDNIAPVIGTLNFNYQPKNFWQWLIGKDSLVITVPVTEEGSGADKITYTETPDGGTVSTKTANIQNGRAEITVSADFKGTISIACTDKANNTSASVTVGAGVAPNGIIIEDNAPKIAFQAENAERLPSGEYKTVPNITVTVADDKNNVISGGIASVSYKIGNGSVKTVDHNYTADMVLHDSFTIPASEISAGETKITVTATDNAGNSVTQNYIVKVHTHSGTLVPAVEPTCTTAGNKEYYTCTCGKWFSDSGCKNEITDHTEVITKALGHDFTGKYQFDTEEHWMKCSRCAATDSREAHSFGEGSNHCTKCEFEKAGEGHTHTGELHERVEPTCTTKGNTAYYTCNCGKWFSDSSCTEEITDKSKIEIAALEHDFVMKHDQNEHWQQCSRCSLEQSRGLHEYDDDSDTDCNVCGYVRTIQHTHSGTLVPAVEPTCTEDGHEAYYTCSCGKWFSDSGCVNEITDHASITVEKRGHDFSGGYQSDENGHWKVCARCNMAQAAESHVFDDEYDTDCNQCGYRRNIENQGNISKDVEKDEKAPDTVLSDSAEELGDIILTEEEKGQIGTGTDIKFILNVKDAGDTVSSGDKTAVQQALDGNTVVKGFSVGQYLDISLFKVIGDTRSAISQTARKLTIVINVPESLKSKDSAKSRTYAIIRVHDGVAEVLADLDGDTDTVTIATDRFSAYALVYKEAGSGADVTPTPTPGGGDQPTPTPGGSDEPSPTPGGSDEPTPTPGGSDKPSPTPGGKDNITPAPSPSEKPEKVSGKEKRKIEIHSGLKAIQTGKKLQISWGRVTGADGYSVYVQYCGKDFSAKSLNQVKSGKKTKITVKKVNGKKLDTAKNFKLYVVAWKWKNGKKSTLTKTLTIHVAGKDSVKYTNVKSIQTGKSSYTLKKGGTVTLHPKAVLYDKHKKQLSAAHCKEFRYLSSNKKVATVTAGGKVKAKGTGECTIYVFAKNGCRRKIKIKVKK